MEQGPHGNDKLHKYVQFLHISLLITQPSGEMGFICVQVTISEILHRHRCGHLISLIGPAHSERKWRRGSDEAGSGKLMLFFILEELDTF